MLEDPYAIYDYAYEVGHHRFSVRKNYNRYVKTYIRVSVGGASSYKTDENAIR